MKSIRQISCWLVLILCVGLGGCSTSATSSPMNLDTSVPTLTPSIAAVSNTPTELPTNTPTSTPPQPTRTPRPTPVPTMTMNEESIFVSKMLQDNSSCRLPCWWGFTPGGTTLPKVYAFFSKPGAEIKQWYLNGEQNYSVYFFKITAYYHSQNYTGKDDTLEEISFNALPPMVNDKYVYGDPQFVKDWEAYFLPQFLSVYGAPSEVWLNVGAADAPWAPFDLVLFYPEQGILVRYEAPAIWGDKVFRLCQYQMAIEMWLWSPQYSPERSQWPYWEDVLGDLSRFRPLETATGMSLTEFVQKMRQPDEQVCLETPQDLWYEGAP